MGLCENGGLFMEMNIQKFERLWHIIGDKERLNGNGYRVLIDIALNCNGATTLQKFVERRKDWNPSSIGKTLRRLNDEDFLCCKLEGRKIVYVVNEELYNASDKSKLNIYVDLDTLYKVWERIANMNELTANGYRVFLDVLLYGETNQYELWTRRKWPSTSVNKTFNKLENVGLFTSKEKNQQKIYSANIDYILSEKKEE